MKLAAQPWGISTHIDLHECTLRKIQSPSFIRKFATDLCDLLEVKAWGETQVFHFGNSNDVRGYTLIQLIETSSITGHFVDSTASAHIDIFSCKTYDAQMAVNFTASYFEANLQTFTVLQRK